MPYFLGHQRLHAAHTQAASRKLHQNQEAEHNCSFLGLAQHRMGMALGPPGGSSALGKDRGCVGNYRGSVLYAFPEGRQASHVALAVLGMASQGEPCSSYKQGGPDVAGSGQCSGGQHPTEASVHLLDAAQLLAAFLGTLRFSAGGEAPPCFDTSGEGLQAHFGRASE